MFKYPFYILLALITASSCSRPEACIEAEEEYFHNRSALLKSCGEAKDFFWDFGDGEGARGTRVTHNFDTTGDKTITQFAIAENGRRESETTENIFVGYKRIDSVIVTRLSLSSISSNSDTNIYITVGDLRSDQTYEHYKGPPTIDDPLKFSFEDIDARYLNSSSNYPFRVLDDNKIPNLENPSIDSTSTTRPFDDINEYPQEFSGDNGRTDFKIYWSLVR